MTALSKEVPRGQIPCSPLFLRFPSFCLLIPCTRAYSAHRRISSVGKWKMKSVSLPISGSEAEKPKNSMMASP